MSQQIFFFENAHPGNAPKRKIVLPPPKTAPLQDTFAEAILEDTSVHQSRNPLDWVISLVVHVAFVIVLVVIPLFFAQRLDLQNLNLTFLVAPAPPAAAPPPPPPSATRTVRVTPKNLVSAKLTAPPVIPKTVQVDVVPTTPDQALAGVPGGVPGGMPGGQLGGVLGGVLGGLPTPLAPVAARSEGPKQPVQVGGAVRPPRLLYGPPPDYPILARQARITGTVIIEAIIDEHGTVVGERAISGPAMLIPAALKAVSERKYEATVLDGEPVPIALRVEVSFNIT